VTIKNAQSRDSGNTSHRMKTNTKKTQDNEFPITIPFFTIEILFT